ncbi:hypothetical protein, partial [Enterococcus faecium]|uniref:hypothetical protein n=1 Tax=Enterococcus faecium TaxID=1352 RepID=UPI0019D6E49C
FLLLHNYTYFIRLIPFIFILIFFIILLIYLIFSSYFVNRISYINTLSGIIRGIFYFCIVFLCINSIFNVNIFFNFYSKITMLATIYLIIQVFAHNLLNINLPWTIPFLNVYQENYNTIDFASFFSDFYRPYSFFLEPGYYVQYILPCLVILLFIKKAYNLKMAIFISIGLVFSTSGQGLIIGLIIWVLYIILELRRNILVFISTSIFFVLLIGSILKISFIERSLARLFGSDTSSSNSRIFEPFSYFMNLETQNKIFGIGYNNISPIFGKVYLNSVSYVLITSGIVGFLFVLMFLISCFLLFKKTESKILLFIFCFLLMIGGIFTTPNTIFYLVLIFGTEFSKGIEEYGELS